MSEYGPTYFRGLIGPNGRLTAFCKGDSKTQSNPDNSTRINDSRAAASEGSIAVGSGATANVSIVNADKEVAVDALQTAETVGVNALETAKGITKDVLNYRSADTDAALALVAETQAGAVKLISDANQAFVDKLASNAGSAPQETVVAIVKWGALIAAAWGAVLIFRKR